MRKIALYASVLGLALSVVGCPPGDGADKTGSEAAKSGSDAEAKSGEGGGTEAAASADISHVKVGQKYIHDMGNNMTSEWEVKAISDDGVITYTMATIMNGSATGEPTEAKWGEKPKETTEAPPADAPPPPVLTDGEDMTIGGVTFQTKIMETENSGTKSKIWLAYMGGEPTFPPSIRTESTGANFSMTQELKEIKE